MKCYFSSLPLNILICKDFFRLPANQGCLMSLTTVGVGHNFDMKKTYQTNGFTAGRGRKKSFKTDKGLAYFQSSSYLLVTKKAIFFLISQVQHNTLRIWAYQTSYHVEHTIYFVVFVLWRRPNYIYTLLNKTITVFLLAVFTCDSKWKNKILLHALSFCF